MEGNKILGGPESNDYVVRTLNPKMDVNPGEEDQAPETRHLKTEEAVQGNFSFA
jgi:hypothetical protein